MPSEPPPTGQPKAPPDPPATPAAPAPGSAPSGVGAAWEKTRSLGWKRILFLALALYGILLAVFNIGRVEISFVFFTTRASLFVVIVLAAGIGFLAGYLFDGLRKRRRE